MNKGVHVHLVKQCTGAAVLIIKFIAKCVQFLKLFNYVYYCQNCVIKHDAPVQKFEITGHTQTMCLISCWYLH